MRTYEAIASAWTLALLCGSTTGMVIQTQNGAVQGTSETSFEGNEFFGFHSIPYAKAPVGNRRFRDPVPYGIWEGVLNATEDGPPCIQIPSFIENGTIGDEDCLWLSVFTPSLMPEANLAVVVWIHGGRWSVGSGRLASYGPHQLVDRGIVVVQLQYRLGAFGWLSTNDAVAPGNYGFRDQLLALKWVRDNIDVFGGNPSEVTLLGQSAGGASVHAHVISPLSTGLFQRAISMSGTANMAWAGRRKDHDQVAKYQAKLVGCPSAPSQALIDCLRSVDAVHLTRSAADFSHFFPSTAAKMPLAVYSPRVDAEADEPFWPRDPTEALTNGHFNREVTWMTGLTSMESSWFTVELFAKMFAPRLEVANDHQLEILGQWIPDPKPGTEEIKRAHEFYFGGERFNRSEHRVRAAEMFSDSLFNYDALVGLYLQSRRSFSNVYFYMFNHIGSWGYANIYREEAADHGGVAHLDDLRYIMSMPWAGPHDDEDAQMVKLYTSMFGNFIKTGDPTVPGHHLSPYRPAQGQYIRINSPTDVEMSRCLPFPPGRMELWGDILGMQVRVQRDFLPFCRADEHLKETELVGNLPATYSSFNEANEPFLIDF